MAWGHAGPPRVTLVTVCPRPSIVRRRSSTLTWNRPANSPTVVYGGASVLRDGLGRAAGLRWGVDGLSVIADKGGDVSEAPDATFCSP
jgi:hypothetical protein